MKVCRVGSMFLLFLVLVMVGGCAASGKMVQMAEKNFHKAEELGAEQKAPYEFYSAKAYLDLAHHEVKDGDSQQAGVFAEQSSSFAEQAISKSGGAR